MVLEYKIDSRSSSLVYPKIFLKCLEEVDLNGKVLQDYFTLKCYVEADETEELEKFATLFAKRLPHSIFLYGTEVNVCEEMPTETTDIENKKRLSTPFCLDCLEKAMDENSENYYDIFTSCDVCGYDIDGEHKNYQNKFKQIATLIKNGEDIKLNTTYGSYIVGALGNICNSINFDIVAYDYATVKKYTHIEDFELQAIASFEKPLITLKTKLQFNIDFEDINIDLIRFKLPDDFILHFLMEELNKFGINLIFITKDNIETTNNLILVEPKEELEPIEVVVSQKHIAIVKGDKGLPKFPITTTEAVPVLGACYSVIKEHKLTNENIVGIYLSKKYNNAIIIHGKKYGTIEYLGLTFRLKSIKNIFDQISATDDKANKLINNYKNKFPEHYNRIINISFDQESLNIYQLWGVLAIILNLTPSNSIEEASRVLQNNTISFLGKKGPRIDYKLIKSEKKTVLDPLMIIRSAMSFKLAGVDNLILSYGIIESFAEFISNEIDSIKESMNTDAVVIAGSLLENKKLFAKISQECSINHNIYFNNQLLVDESNILYGGMECIK